MLEKIATAAAAERKAIFIEAANIKKIPAAMIEKDFWVCWTLNRLFSNNNLSKILRFKGGTSLSKVFGVIERFSEDIDLILDWNIISGTKEIIQPSNTRQDARNKEIIEESKAYISTTLKKQIEKVVNDICKVIVEEENISILQIQYPKGIEDDYILPHIKLEIGPLAAWTPNETYTIKPYIDGINKNLVIDDIKVPTIILERTFWEKVTILHREHYRPDGRYTPIRYSRHYYDLYQIGSSKMIDSIIQRTDLLEQVVEFKKRFYMCGWAKYDLAVRGSIELMPNSENKKYLKDDYTKMKGMIFGDYPSWEEILIFLEKLQEKINN